MDSMNSDKLVGDHEVGSAITEYRGLASYTIITGRIYHKLR